MTSAGNRNDVGATPHRIDIHHHVLPPKYVAELSELVKGERPPGNWTPERSLEDMDRNGIALSMLSLMQPQVWFGDIALGRRLTRECNDYAASVARDHPGRFGFFATLPLPDTEGSLQAIDYALGTLKAGGFGLMTSYAGQYLGDPAFWPVLEELNRRRAVVYTHPLSIECCRNPIPQYMVNSAIEYATDTSRTIASLLFSGAAARFPDIKWIFSHSGGFTPFLVSRFEREEKTIKDIKQKLPNGLKHELAKFYYDMAQGNHPSALDALLQIAPASQFLYGTDYPFRDGKEVNEALAKYQRFTSAERRAIDRGNALRLLPSLGAAG